MTAAMERVADMDWLCWEPKDRATLLFIVQGSRMLLIHKKKGLGAGKINGPGGRIDPGEAALECAVREIREELCIEALSPRWMGRLHFQFQDGYSIRGDVFLTDRYEGEPTETGEAVPVWVDTGAIPYERMWADDRLWLPRMLAGQRFCGYFIFDGDRMVDADVHAVTDAELARAREAGIGE